MPELIRDIRARKILNSGGRETIEIIVRSDNHLGFFSVPAGKSVGRYEASPVSPELAIINIKDKIFPIIKNKKADFKTIDKILIEQDDSLRKRNLGANVILGISIALAKIQAKIEKKPLFTFLSQFFPLKEDKKLTLLMNLIEGGVHSVNGSAIQEYLILIQEENFKEGVFLGSKIYRELGNTIKANVGYEGGYAIQTKDPKEPLKILSEIIKKKGVSSKVSLGLDIAASQIFNGKKYKLNGEELSPEELQEFYLELLANYNIYYLEDPFEENDFDNFAKLKQKVEDCFLVGDDLTTTNIERLQKAIQMQSISGIIIKPNQIGTLSETIDIINAAKENNIEIIISHRGEDTNDSFIADLAVACDAFGLKAGAPARGERVAKYNRLLEIEEFIEEFKK